MRSLRFLLSRRGAVLSIAIPLLLSTADHTAAQEAFPDLVVQDVDWTSGMRFFSVTQPIVSPGAGNLPASSTAEAHTEFISGTEIHLTPGFHAGDLSGVGRFRAWINIGLGDADDVAIISPVPNPHGDGVPHVNKWEKLEVGVILPEDYQEAIARFFANYYPNSQQADWTSDPSNTDAVHDLNPYADDSLQLVMTLTDPSGDPRMKWGFFMREAKWNPWTTPLGLGKMMEDVTSTLAPYNIRFRISPDEEGPWQFSISIKAPHTQNLAAESLAEVYYNGYSFVCDPPFDDNKGYLEVNQNNGRVLQFEDGTPFFALGTNMGGPKHGDLGIPDPPGPEGPPPDHWYSFYKRDFDEMKKMLEELNSVGGNYMRTWLFRNVFAPEWVNLGVYDHHFAPAPCPPIPPGTGVSYTSNCQYECWAFDKILDHARVNDIYIELCIDPAMPTVGFEDIIWGNHAYVRNFLEPAREPPVTGPYDLQKFFYSYDPPDPANGVRLYDRGAFYYWKRKYKYIMSRWGYSVNLPIIEPFNEMNQMLTYVERGPGADELGGVCPDNLLLWEEDPELPETVDQWLTDIISYVKGDVDFENPVLSPLGEKQKLFLMSYADASPADPEEFYEPFENPGVDLIDVHFGMNPSIYQLPDEPSDPDGDLNEADTKLNSSFVNAKHFWDEYNEDANPGDRRPFNHGEFQHYTKGLFNGFEGDIENLFLNYDVSFHNELWASVFSGKYAAGTSFHWARIFWWPDAMPIPPTDPNNTSQIGPFSNVEGDANTINLGTLLNQQPKDIENRKLHHHFRPLADLLTLAGQQSTQLFTQDYSVHQDYDVSNDVECYYLKSADNRMVVGWVHNRHAWTTNNFYLSNTQQNILGCLTPNAQSVWIPGLAEGESYHISWFPTRLNTTECPADAEDDDGDDLVILQIDDPASAAFSGTLNNYLDTLHVDYAFIITPEPLVKSLPLLPQPEVVIEPSWDFTLYPNPTRGELYVRLPDEAAKDIMIYDLSGRQIRAWSSVTGSLQHLPIGELAKGSYWVRVSDGANSKSKKLIIH